MSLRAGSNRGLSRSSALDKRVPRNPRYADIQSKVNSGMTVDKLTFVTTRQHLKRQDETFFRITPAELSELLTEYEQDRHEGVLDFCDHIDPDHHGPRVVEHEADDTPTYERPYIILDVREARDFHRCHITQARSFETKLLKQDRMTPELHKYKNKEGRLVILYADEDREACRAAKMLIEKGFDNTFVLSGGLVLFARKFDAFVEGDIESLPAIPPATGGRLSVGRVARGSGGGSGSASHAQSCGEGTTVRGSTHGSVRGTESRRSNSRGRGGGGGELVAGRREATRNSSDSSCLTGGALRTRAAGDAASASSTTTTTTTSSSSARASLTLRRDLADPSRKRADAGAAGGPRGWGLGSSAGHQGGRGEGGGQTEVFDARGAELSAGRERGLARAAVAASAARRRSVEGMLGGGYGDVSRGSAATVADSVISRASARRGKW